MTIRFPLHYRLIAVFAVSISLLGPRLAQAQSTSFKFQFGAEKAAPGYTLVSPTQQYSKETGFGFETGATLRAVAKAGANPIQAGAITSDRPFQFSVAVPEGNYRVNITLGDPEKETVVTIKSERRRLMVERLQVPAGQFVTRTILANVRTPKISTGGQVNLNDREMNKETGAINSLNWDDKLTIGFSDTHPAVAAMEIEKVTDAITLFILGDSTTTDQDGGGSWGQMAPRWFGPGVVVANHAESGETLRGFMMHRRWDKVLDSVKPGDYVFIVFGTNDSKQRGAQNMYAGQDFSQTYAEADTTYRELLKKFAAEVTAKKGHPIIGSPAARRGETQNPSSLGAWAISAMAAAKEINVPGVDLSGMGFELNKSLGADAARLYADGTHPSEYGAYMWSKCVVLGIKQSNLPLAKYIVEDFGNFDPTHPKPLPTELNLPADGNRGGGRGRGAAGAAGPATAPGGTR